MNTCPHCNGQLYRHGKSESATEGQRYRCKFCRKSITVRNGKIVNPHEKPSLIVKDWRHQPNEQQSGIPAARPR